MQAARHRARLVFSVVVLLLAHQASAAHHYPDYPVRPATEYPNKIWTASIVVAAEPLDDPGQQKTYFNDRLSAAGILPVFVVIQNISPSDTYLFDKAAIGLADQSEATGKAAHRIVRLLGSGGLVDLNLIDNANFARENMMKKGIHSKTLAPGGTVSGFVYIPISTDSVRQKIHLQVPLTNSQSGEAEVLNLFF